MAATEACSLTCLYCEQVLAPRHEHDHFPVPRRNGGTLTFCACINCHERKDRTPLGNWAVGVGWAAMWGLWEKLSTDERILLAKIAAALTDVMRQRGEVLP